MDWTAGYVADIGYTYGYYKELNPLHIKLAFLNAGLAVPEVVNACELGFGQGISVNVHAAASTTQWHGTDFNPSQAAFAQELAAQAAPAKPVQLFDQGFAEFCTRPDLPEFDYIGLHGIWSWISDENRAVIVDFLRRKLKVGGVVYISYNTQPGWAALAPLRHLMSQHAEVMGAPGDGTLARVNDAMAFTEKLLATNPVYAKANPAVQARFDKMKGQNRHYLAHEYFNRDWQPMPFSSMLEALAPAKLSYACPAAYIGHIDMVNLTVEQRSFLREVPDPMFRETLRDFMINQQFRKDFWIKGGRTLSPLDKTEALHQLRVMLVTPRSSVPSKVSSVLGEVTLKPDMYDPILDLLADHAVRSVGQIAQALKNIKFDQIIEALLMLGEINAIALAQDQAVIEAARAPCARLNLRLMRMARSSAENQTLASPVTGGGVGLNRFEQLFLLGRGEGAATPQALAAFVWQLLLLQGQRVSKDGAGLASAEENLAELQSQAEEFTTQRLPVLIALGLSE